MMGTRQLLTVLALCLTVISLLVPGYPLLTLAVLLLCVGLLV
jgi:hypothetical protein